MAMRAADRERLFPDVPEERADFPAVSVDDPRRILTDAVAPRLLTGKPIALRVQRYFPRVRDFERDDKGNVIPGSLTGPERIEARRQLARERAVAIEEVKMLKAEVDRCYKLEGVNHLENCKHLVKAYATVLDTPFYGMLKAPSHF